MSFPRYPEYKDSGVEWLGKVPAHWEVVKLSYLAISKGGGTPPKDELQYWNGSIPWVTPKDMKQQWITSTIDTLSEAALHASPVSMVEPGHVLIVFRSGILRHRIPVAINKVSVTVNQDVRAYDVSPRLLPDFFLRLVQGLNRELLPEWSKQGATVESLESELVNSTQLPVPSRSEQEAITAFLEHETAHIDALVEEQKRLVELLKEKRQAVISHAVTKGLDPDVPMKDSGVEWLGEVPAHWEVRKIAQSFNRIGSGTTPPSNEQKWYEGGSIPWVTTSELRETVIVETKKSVTEEALSEFTSLQLHPPGSLAIAMYGATIGRLGVFGVSATSNQACCVLSGGRGVSTGFVYYWLLAFKGVIISLYATGGGQPNINQETISSLRIPAPSLEDQQDITAYLDDETSRIEDLVEEGLSVIKLLQERRSALISAAVTGKIDVRGWQPPAGSSALTEATRTEAV